MEGDEKEQKKIKGDETERKNKGKKEKKMKKIKEDETERKNKGENEKKGEKMKRKVSKGTKCNNENKNK